jgi:thioredoxin reductase (NADPH)
MANSYDVLIIGGGCTGFATAMYSGRFELKTLVLGDKLGGTIILTDVVENYPGFHKLTGLELAEKLREHALDYKSVEIKEELATDVSKEGDKFIVKTESEQYDTKTLIFATGTKTRMLNVPGEGEFMNKGVHYCALCDAPMYKNKVIGVVGGSDSAAKEALLISEYASKTYIIYRGDKIRPEPINYERVMQKVKEGKMEIIYNTNVVKINGDNFLKSVTFDKPYKESTDFPLGALFIEIGHIPLSDLAVKIGVKTNEKKEIIIDRSSKTNIPGVFAAGDVVDTAFKQAITGVGEGVSASYSAYMYLKEKEIHPTTAPEYHKPNGTKDMDREQQEIQDKAKKA